MSGANFHVDRGQALKARVDAVNARIGLVQLIGRTVKLVQRGREHAGLCPFHQERSPSFTVVPDKGFAHCFGCGWHGDALRFAMDSRGITFGAALEMLEAEAGIQPGQPLPPVRHAPAARARAAQDSPLVDGRAAAAWVWQQARPARGLQLGEAWLRSRGIDPAGNGFLDVARLLPDCPAALWRKDADPRTARRKAPALIAPILRVSGAPGERALSLAGVHITFLRPDGAGKAQFAPYRDRRSGEMVTPPARVMWGVAARGAVPIPARQLVPGDRAAERIVALIDGAADLPGYETVIGEGLESTQSLLARRPNAVMGWATLSLGNLEGHPAMDGPQGSLPLWRLRQDPERAGPFTIARPGRVVIGIDADMKPLKDRRVQEQPRGPVVKRDVTGMERAAICAGLSADAWRRAGAARVEVVRPPAGHDFNDLDQGEAA